MCFAAVSVLIWFSTGGFVEADVMVTTICFLASVAVSIWLLGDVEDFLSDPGHGLDFYAWNAGFIQEWRKKSRRPLMEACSCLLLMWVLRCLIFSQIIPSAHDLLLSISFCVASGGFMAVAYLELHVLSGLELAIDSFSVNFFRVMDVKEALADWNVLQAMLRHISAKLSTSLLPLGCTCGASILYLIESSLLRPDVEGGFDFILQNLWCLPPNCFFLYTLMRAAAVTEKASRVSPLVNSWNFENIDGPDDLPDWMDLERQYLVQYIIQSEAGFYIQGVRLRFFQVSKMCYYLGAILFAVVSQVMSWTPSRCSATEEFLVNHCFWQEQVESSVEFLTNHKYRNSWAQWLENETSRKIQWQQTITITIMIYDNENRHIEMIVCNHTRTSTIYIYTLYI